MDFGVFGLVNRRDADRAPRDLIAGAVEQVVRAEELGFSTAWFAEHHFSNYSLSPSPLLTVAYCAPRTRRIRLATGVLVLPLYAPARLVAEIGAADTMCGGRLVLGVGSGYQPYEFERFGVGLAESEARSLEMLDMMEAGLADGAFAHDGVHYRQPPTPINVPPLQRPLPEIWVAGSAPGLLRRAAERGWPVMGSGRLDGADSLAAARAGFERTCESAGADPAGARFAALTAAHVCDSRAEALEFAENLRYQVRLSANLRNREETLENGMLRDRPIADEPSLERIADALMIGPAAHCAARCVDLLERVRPCHVALYFSVGRIPPERALRSMERFAREVVPAVEKAVGPLASFARAA